MKGYLKDLNIKHQREVILINNNCSRKRTSLIINLIYIPNLYEDMHFGRITIVIL